MYSPMIGFELMKTKIKTTVIKQNETTAPSLVILFVDLIFFIQVHQHDGE
jgi:hypothetical protein